MEKQLGAIIWSVDRVKGADLGVLAFFKFYLQGMMMEGPLAGLFSILIHRV